MISRPCLANARPCGHAMSTGRAVKATFGPSTLVMSDAPLHKLLSPANLSRTVERPNEKQELKCNKGRSPQSPSRSTRLDWSQSRVLVESHPFARGFEITQDLAPSGKRSLNVKKCVRVRIRNILCVRSTINLWDAQFMQLKMVVRKLCVRDADADSLLRTNEQCPA